MSTVGLRACLLASRARLGDACMILLIAAVECTYNIQRIYLRP